MSDPIRLIEDGAEASAEERALLSLGRTMNPPSGAQDAIWASLSAQIGPGGGNGGGGNGGGASGAGSSGGSLSGTLGGLKGAILGFAGIATIAGTIAALLTSSPSSPEKSHSLETPSATEPSTAQSAEPEQPVVAHNPAEMPNPVEMQNEQPAPLRVPSPKAAPTSNAASTRQEKASRLREENRMLAEARAALRKGDSASALEKLDAAGGQFPDGVLAQEREVLAIEALMRAGKRKEASDRASAFLQKYPTSPHAPKVRAFVQ